MTGYQERRREALEATMKDEVFRVAADILRAEGFEALTMDRIAREVGVSRATLYNYFADAEEVLASVEARTFEPVSEDIDDIAGGPLDPPDKLRAIATTLFDGLNRDRALALALFSKRETKGRRAELKVELRNSVLCNVRQIIDDGIAQGRFREVRSEAVAECFLGAVSGIIDTMLYAGEPRPAAEVVPDLMDLMLFGMQPRAIASPPESGD